MRLFLLSLCLIGGLFSVKAQSDWEMSKVEDGITVYIRDRAGTPFKDLKAVMEVEEARISSIVAILLDYKNSSEWSYNVHDCKQIAYNGEHDFTVHFRVKVPFPFSDRDVINRMVTKKRADGSVRIDLLSEPTAIPDKDDLVRMDIAQGYWEITPLANGKVKVVHQYEADPKGNIPAWAVNTFIASGPIHNFKAIREKAKQPPYRDVELKWLAMQD